MTRWARPLRHFSCDGSCSRIMMLSMGRVDASLWTESQTMKRNRVLVPKKIQQRNNRHETKKRPSYLTKVRARSDADTRGWFNASGPQVVALPPLSGRNGPLWVLGGQFRKMGSRKGALFSFWVLLLHTTILKRSRHSMPKNTWNKGNETGKGAFLAAQPVRNGHARSFRRSSSSTLVGCLTDHVKVALQQVRSLEFKKQFSKRVDAGMS